MRPLMNQTHNSQTLSSRITIKTAAKLLAILLIVVAVPLALYVRVKSEDSAKFSNAENSVVEVTKRAKQHATVQAAGRGKPFLNLQDGREMSVTFRGDQAAVAALQSGAARARALASADFDGNATPDVVAGYSYNGSGIITLQRGNPEAFAPADDSVFVRMQQGYNPASLLPGVEAYSVPAPADLVVTGNFTGDSEKDVVFAAKGGGLYLMKGNGTGGFEDPQQINLPGPVTALAAGEFRASDGITDLAVGVSGPGGEQLLVFDDGADGFANALVQYQLSGPASGIEFGGLDDDSYMDVAVAAGNEVLVAHGWGRKENLAPESRVERFNVGPGTRGLALGQFTWDREGRLEIAALTSDGTVHIVENGKLDTRPLTEAEAAQRTRGNLKPQKATKFDIESAPSWKPAQAGGWKDAKQILGNNLSADLPKPLIKTNLARLELEEVMLVGQTQSKLEILRPIGKNDPDLAAEQSLAVTDDTAKVTMDVEGSPVAVLALPSKLNGTTDVVMLDSMSTSASIVPNAPNTTITVDRTDDPSGAGLTAASACTAALNDCSLRGALQFANLPANNNTTISLPANTYILSINGTSAGGCDGNTVGDLGANRTMSIVGAGAATTIIRQTGTGPANDGDRVMCMNEPFTLDLIYNFSGFTMVGGRDGTSAGTGTALGGGGIIGGEKGNVLSLTNVVLANNQVTVLGSANIGGGGIQWTGGDLNITNCTIGGTAVPGAYADRTSTNTANLQAGSGGGVMFTPSAPQHTASTGILTVSGTTFSRNTAGSVSAGGGGADLLTFAFAAPGGGGTGSATIGTSTFSNNVATPGNGGGIVVESLATTVATTSFTSNSAGNRGGGIFVGGSSLLLNGATPSITFTGNTATLGGSSVSTSAAVNVAGTNTTIGGSIEVNTGGAWTNNAGSTLSPTDVVVTGGTFNMNNSTMNVSGNLTIGPGPIVGSTFNGNTGTVNIQGNFVLNAGGAPATTLNAGTGTFNFNGTAAQSITNGTSITFFNLTDSNVTNPLTANNSFAVAGTLNVNGANAIFAPVAAAVISGGGTLTGTGTARVTRTASIADFSSQYTITTKTLTNLTVEYIGAAAQILSPITFGPLKINNGSGVTLSGTSNVNGLLTLTTGALNVASQTLVINDGSSVGGGSIISNANGTVSYNQGSDGQNVRAFNYGNLTFSNFNKVLEPTGVIGIAGVFTPGTATGHTIAGSTVNFNGTGAQTVPAFNFNNLTISGARGANNVTLVNGGTIGVAGIFNPIATFAGGNYVIANNTVDFNGSGAQTIPAFNYFNLTSSNAGARTLANSGIIGIASVFTPGTNVYTIAGSTVSYNGTSAQTLPSTFTTYFNLTSNNAAGVTGFAGLTVQQLLRVQTGTFTSSSTYNNVQIDAGATLAGTNGTTINMAGNWTNNGTFTANGNTVNFAGSGAQVIGGTSVTTFNNLTIANAVTPVSLGTNANVNAVLTLSNDLTTGANILTMPNTGTSAGTADVIGNVRRTGFVGGGPALSFGNPFNSIGFIAQGTVPTDILVNLVKAVPGGFPSGASILRTYTITPNGGAGFSATLRLHYLDAELNGNVETTLGLFRNTPPWVRLGRTGAVDTVNNWAELAGVTQFSQWTLSSARNNTTTEITADTPDPSQINESVTINFTVLSAVAGAPQVTGNVTITVNDASGDTCTGSINPVDGTGTCSIAFTTFGLKTLTATYNGDDNFNTSTDTEQHEVDEPDVTVAVAPASVLEDGPDNLVYTFTREGQTTGELIVNFTVTGTAVAADYVLTGATTFDTNTGTGTVTIPIGSATTTFTVNPNADTTVEPDETVIANVAAGTGYDIGTPGSATGTITNDDTDVSVAVAPSSTLEDGAGNLVYTFTRAGVTTGELTANFTVSGTATFNTDYTQTGAATFAPPNGTVTFAAGSSTATVTVDPTADTTVEVDETVILTVAAGTGYNVAAVNSSATGTITNDDTDVSIAVAPPSVAEDGPANLVYTFTRTGVTATPLTVNFTIAGTATFNTDYTQTGAATFTPPNGTVTFGAGNTTATVTVDPTADITSETDETVILTLASGTGYNVIEPSSATGTITDDDVTVSVAVSPASVGEDGLTNLVYTFTRNDPEGALTVNFTIGGTATFNTDYTQTGAASFTPPNGTVNFVDGELTATVTVDPVADTTVEPDETVILTVIAGTGYGVGAPNSATGTITNDDVDVSVAVAPTSTLEDGAGNLVFTFTRTGVTTGELVANFTIGGNATFNTDYTQTGATTFTPPTGTVTFAPGSSTATVTVDPTADTTVEPDETVVLTVAAGTGYGIGANNTATGTITNDDTDVSIAVAPSAVNEDGVANLVYTFTRTGVTSSSLTVNFSIAGTATFNTDYTQTGAASFIPPNGTVTFGAGNSTATVTVDPTADITSESDETVILTLASGTGYNVVEPSSATGTITNDDVVVSVAVSPGAVDEDGLTNLVYTFTRNDSNGPLTANFSIGGTATFNTDYMQTGAATFVPPNGTVTFADGSLTTTVTVDPVADVAVEPDETVILTVVAGSGYAVGSPSSATGTITNDDTDVSVAVAPSSTAEDGVGNLVFTFTRSGVTTGALTANFTIDGTATFNTDYTQTGATTFTPPNGTVQFAAGSSTATVTVDPTADNTVEPDETVILTVAAGTGYGIGANNTATGTITNDDTDVSVAVAPASVAEDGAANLVYTFTRNGVTTGGLTVNFTIGGTATFATDYTQAGAATFVPPNGTVIFGAGNSTATVTVNPTADMTSEPDETVILTVAAGTGYNVATPSSATGTILNDDNVDVEITAKTDTPDPVCVGQNITYTIGFRNNSAGAATNATVTDTIPANTTFVSATLPMGWSRADSVVAGGTGTLMFTNPSVAGGGTASFTVVVKINNGVVGGTVISNTATASSGAPDDVPGNNSKTALTTVDATPPTVSAVTADPSSLWPKNHKMRDVTINYTATDSCGGVVCQITNITSNEPINGTGDGDTAPDWEFVDEHHVRLRAESAGGSVGRIYTVTVTCTDSAGNTTTKSVEVHVGHNILSPTSGTAFKINTAVTFTGTFWDVPGKRHTAVWQFDDLTTGATVVEPAGSKNGTAKGTYTFKEPGVYKVTLKVTDNTGVTSWVDTQDDVESIVVIYDPTAGFTVGGGWISSPLGAFVSDPTLTGKMTFGFNSKFFKGATNPKGESQIDFLLGGLDFNALNYEYLVIEKARAQFKGFGKINGSAGYDFIITVIDGNVSGGGGVDKFRIKIWEKTTGIIVYDTQMGASDLADPSTALGPGGSISIQEVKGK